MSAPTATWAQAIEKVLLSSEKEWLSPSDILREIKRQNLKEICASVPLCSVKKILYRNNGPFIWDKIKHVFALKSRVDNKVNEQSGTAQVDENEVSEHKAVTKEEETANHMPLKNDKLCEESKQSEGDNKTTPQCYDSPCGYVVTVDPDNNNLTKHTNKSSSKLMPSPIRCAFPVRLLQSTTTRSCQSRSSKSSVGVKDKNTIAIPVIEYDTLFDTTGDTCVAVLDKFRARIVDPYEYDPSQSEESAQSHPSENSKDMEGSRGDGDEVDKSGKNVKKTPPSASKLKRSAEKRKQSEDSNLASVNIKSLLTMDNFVKLSKESKQQIISLLPPIDRCDEYTPTSSAFTNTFFNSACRQWQQLLQSGQLSMSQRAKQKLEEASRNKVVDEWKKQHFEEELSEDTPPQDPKSKLFYPVPLSATHQRVLGCIKRVCQDTQDTRDTQDNCTTSLAATSIKVADQLSEQENEPPDCESPPEQCSESHEISIESQEMNGKSHEMNGESHEMNGESHEMNSGSHEMNVESHEMNSEPPSESDHEENKPQLIDDKVNDKLSLELNNNSSEKNSKLYNGEIPDQRGSGTFKLNSEKSPEQNKKLPGRLSIQNNKLLGRSCEHMDLLHDQNCVSPVGKGKQLEQDGRLLSRSLEQEIEKARLSLKLQINKLSLNKPCQQELYRQLELLSKSAEHQASSRSPTSADLNNLCDDSNKSKKKIKPCLKSPMNKFGQGSTTTETNCGSGKEIGTNMCLTNNMPLFTNHLTTALPFSILKTPALSGLRVPQKFETGIKRKLLLTTSSSTKKVKVCNNTRADFLTVLPAAYMYSDILAELRRSSIHTYKIPKRAGRKSRTDWQSLHSIHHDHSYAIDYVPLSSTTDQEQSTTVCGSCMEPMLICESCKRCVHNWCLVPNCPYCNDCLYVLPLV